jgi:predicted unusual protein kinase regulating ubiquinone biosynthesis (AarF/ABC1/UbiB family)
MSGFRRSDESGHSARRRRELRARLAEAGLLRRRLRAATATEILGAERSPAERLGELLNDLGPMYAAFREYLSLRADLLPLPDCHDLSRKAAEPPPLGREFAMDLLRRELGDEADLLILTLSEPLRGNPLFQWHGAELPDGTPVTIKLLRPELQSQFNREAELIPILGDIRLLARDGLPADMEAAAEGFRGYLLRRMDLAAEVRELRQMEESVRDFGDFTVVRAHPQLSSSRVATWETPPGATPLAETSVDDQDLGRRLALPWLQQALLGGLYPEAPLDDTLALLPDGRPVITGGRLGRLDRSLRRDLLRYLTAGARDEMDRACDLLLDQCEQRRGATAHARMQRLFRLAEPFRAGGWSRHYAGQRLSDTLFVQWRMAHANQYRFKPPLQAFARGLYDLERHCRRLAPQRDGLRQGLDDVRVIAAAVRLREYLGPSSLQENLHELAQNASLLLRRATDNSRKGTGENREKPPVNGRRDRLGFALGLLMVTGCLGLIGSRLLPSGGLGDAAESLAALLYILLALAFFRYVGHKYAG